jgi:uncharacterized membrane protein YfcA
LPNTHEWGNFAAEVFFVVFFVIQHYGSEGAMEMLSRIRNAVLPFGSIPRPSILIFILIWGTAFPDIPVGAALIIGMLAFVQNAGYSLQSRAGNRTSNLYHFIAAAFSTTIFYISLSYLVYLKVTLAVLLVYIFGTMLGSVYGTRLSVRLEKMIGAVADLGAEAKGQALSLWDAACGLSLLLLGEIVVLGLFYSGIISSRPSLDVAGVLEHLELAFFIACAALVANALFASLRVARSTDAYWFHMVLVLLQSAANIAVYGVLVKANGNWYLFGPYLTGSILGSLLGAEWGKRFGKFIKASYGAREVEAQEILYPWKQFIVCWLLLVPHIGYFKTVGLADELWIPQLLILGAAVLQASAFTVVSRARQRNHELYLEWASVFSNGIWFVTLNILVVNSLAPYLIVPYLVGMGVGSLWGQNIAIRIENEIGATMDGALKK